MSSSLCSEATSAEVSIDASSGGTAAPLSSATVEVQEDLAFSLDNLSLLVEDIKDGFAATMQQLVTIEGQDAELRCRLDTVELATLQKMDALQTAVQQMREQFASVMTRVETLELHHRRLEGQMDQLDRAQAESRKMSVDGVCCHHPVYDARAVCQTPMTPYSCATPLSPDSGRPGTCTPSCYHGNEFQSGEHIRSDAVGQDSAIRQAPPLLPHRSCSATIVATTTAATTVAATTPTPSGQSAARSLCHHGVGGGVGGGGDDSCEAIAEQSLHMSRALVERFAHADSSGEDCELDSLATEAPCDDDQRLTGCPNGTASQQSNGCSTRQVAPNTDAAGTTPQVRQVAPHERLQHQDRRRRVCQEIVETERKYCSCLWTIIDLIAESLKSATFMTMKDLCLIFPKCLPRLYELHSTFFGLLERRLVAEAEPAAGGGAFEESSRPTSKAAGSTFSAVVLEFLEANDGELLDLYRDYANDFGTAVRTIRKYQQHSARFRKLLHSLQHHPSCEGLDLTAFLLTPVQRMPRYLLLMRQLNVHTPAGHRDQGSLDCVLDRLHCLLDELNYSIQTALRQAAAGTPPQQQQQRWKRSRSLTRPQDVKAPSAGLATTDADSLLSGSSGRSGGGGSGGRHFLAAAPSASSGRRAAAAALASARCRSVPPPPQQQQHPQQQQRHRTQTPTRTESPKMGPRSRFISRQLRTADRCMSAGDILRASPAPSLAGSNTSQLLCEERAEQRLVRRGSPPKSTLKESFRRMFQSRRKSSLAKLESPPTCSTFEDENGDPCTDV